MILYLVIIGLLQSMNFSQQMVFVRGNEVLDDFYIDKYEVTLADFEEFVIKTGFVTHDERMGEGIVIKGLYKKVKGVNWRHDIHGILIEKELYPIMPVTRVNYYDAKAYAEWKNKSLPTIEQWLYAANEGQTDLKYRFSGSNNLNQVGWFERNSREYNQKVGLKQPNSLGIFDLSGNVAELVILENNGESQVQYVGGSFFDDKSEADLIQVRDREGLKLNSLEATKLWSKPNHGFRCVYQVTKDK